MYLPGVLGTGGLRLGILPEPVPPWPGGPVDRERWGSSADYRAGLED